MGLLDQLGSFAQGASNGVAGSVTGPVDGLAWLLRKAGVPVPSNPVGGSDWMAQQGLLREPKERMAGLLGEGVGSALPSVIAAKAPQIASGLLAAGDNIAAPSTLNKQAGVINWPGSPKELYHGSAKEFDRFDPGKLGSNTGANDASIGFHFADNAADADLYASMAAKSAGLDRGHIGKFDVGMQKPLVISPFPEDGNIPEHLIQELLDNKLLAKRYAIDNGFDGIVFPYGTNVDSAYTAIAFSPDQIRKLPK